jgi:hypothetical protein
MFGPSFDDVPMLLADIRSTLHLYESEYRRALDHLEVIVRDMTATAQTRKPTAELVSSIHQTHEEVKRILAEAGRYVHSAETSLDVLRNEVLNLEHYW